MAILPAAHSEEDASIKHRSGQTPSSAVEKQTPMPKNRDDYNLRDSSDKNASSLPASLKFKPSSSTKLDKAATLVCKLLHKPDCDPEIVNQKACHCLSSDIYAIGITTCNVAIEYYQICNPTITKCENEAIWIRAQQRMMYHVSIAHS